MPSKYILNSTTSHYLLCHRPNLSLCPLYPLQSNFYAIARMILVNPLTGHILPLLRALPSALRMNIPNPYLVYRGPMCSGPWLKQYAGRWATVSSPSPTKVYTDIYTYTTSLSKFYWYNACVAGNLQLVINYTVCFTVNFMYQIDSHSMLPLFLWFWFCFAKLLQP